MRYYLQLVIDSDNDLRRGLGFTFKNFLRKMIIPIKTYSSVQN